MRRRRASCARSIAARARRVESVRECSWKSSCCERLADLARTEAAFERLLPVVKRHAILFEHPSTGVACRATDDLRRLTSDEADVLALELFESLDVDTL